MNLEENTTKDAEVEAPISDEIVKFKGKYTETVGRRKTSVARVRVYKNGNGFVMVNDQKLVNYFANDKVVTVRQPLKLTSHLRDLNISVITNGGGLKGQAEAIRHGIARALVEIEPEIKDSIKAKGWLTRDARKKERKKPGLKKARKAPQWAKR